jgi:hypothetical protein
MALFPTLVLYSALTLREAYVWFFTALALIGVVQWAQQRHWGGIVLAFLGFGIAAAFHGAMLLGALAFGGLLFAQAAHKVVAGLCRAKLTYGYLPVLVIAFTFVAYAVMSGMNIPKIGSLSAFEWDLLLTKGAVAAREGGAAYPSFVIASTPSEIFTLAPLRVGYFLFAPFPWDVRTSSQAVGLIDGLMYLALVTLLVLNLKSIWANPGARWVLIITAALVVVFAFGVGNFGTGIRHRAKLLLPIIVLAAPLLSLDKLLHVFKVNANRSHHRRA